MLLRALLIRRLLSDKDSNPDYGYQKPVCYRYTIRHSQKSGAKVIDAAFTSKKLVKKIVKRLRNAPKLKNSIAYSNHISILQIAFFLEYIIDECPVGRELIFEFEMPHPM